MKCKWGETKSSTSQSKVGQGPHQDNCLRRSTPDTTARVRLTEKRRSNSGIPQSGFLGWEGNGQGYRKLEAKPTTQPSQKDREHRMRCVQQKHVLEHAAIFEKHDAQKGHSKYSKIFFLGNKVFITT